MSAPIILTFDQAAPELAQALTLVNLTYGRLGYGGIGGLGSGYAVAVWWLLGCALLCLQTVPMHRLRSSGRTPHRREFCCSCLWFLAVATAAMHIVLAVPWGMLIAGGLVGVTCWRTQRARQQHKQQQRHTQYRAQLFAILGAQLRAGTTFVQALERGAEIPDLPATLAQGLAAAARRMRAGGEGVEQLAHVPGLEQLTTVMQVSQERGIAAAALISQSQRRLEAQLQHAQALQAGTQGARVTARILLGLPVVGMLMAMVLGIDIAEFFAGTLIGQVLLVLGVGCAVVGWCWTERILSHACDVAT